MHAKQSSSVSLSSCNYFLQQVLKIVVGAMHVVVMMVVVVVFPHYLRDTTSSVCSLFCRFHKIIWKLLLIEPQRHKFTVRISGPPRSARVNLRKPVVRAMLVLVTLKVPPSICRFALSGSGRTD